jgi:Flp pilus assembly protein protease CpaA
MSVTQHDVARSFATDQFYRTVRTLIRCTTVIVIFYFGFRALEVLAGQDTKLSVALSLVFTALADIKFAAAITLAGGTTAWAVMERSLRLRKVDNMQGRVKELEQMIDPSRSSSGLTTRGTTNPQDRLR